MRFHFDYYIYLYVFYLFPLLFLAFVFMNAIKPAGMDRSHSYPLSPIFSIRYALYILFLCDQKN